MTARDPDWLPGDVSLDDVVEGPTGESGATSRRDWLRRLAWRLGLSRVRAVATDWRFVLGFLGVAVYAAVATVGVSRVHEPGSVTSPSGLQPFRWENYPLGTTSYGSDVLAVIVHDAPALLTTAGVGALAALVTGLLAGWLATRGRVRRRYLQSVARAGVVVPTIPVLVVLVTVEGAVTPVKLGVLLGVANAPAVALVAATQAPRVVGREYVEATRATNGSSLAVVRAVAPALAPILSWATARATRAVVFQAYALALVGVLPVHRESLGGVLSAMLEGGTLGPRGSAQLLVIVAVWLGGFVLAVTLLGRGLERAAQPQLRTGSEAAREGPHPDLPGWRPGAGRLDWSHARSRLRNATTALVAGFLVLFAVYYRGVVGEVMGLRADHPALPSGFGEEPVLVSLFAFLDHAVRAHLLGEPVSGGLPFGDAVSSLPWTLLVTVVPLLLGTTVRIGLGALAAYLDVETGNVGFEGGALVAAATPYFLVAMLLIGYVVVGWNVVDPSQRMNVEAVVTGPGEVGMNGPFILDVVVHAALPMTALFCVGFGAQELATRAAVREVRGAGHVRAARLRGVAERTVRGRHVVRVAGRPLYPEFVGAVGTAFGAAVIVESIFDYPGLGAAMTGGDLNVAMAGACLLLGVSVLGALAVDLAYGVYAVGPADA